MKHLLFALPAVATLAVGFGSAPALAYNGNQFIDACKKISTCEYGVSPDGHVQGHNNGVHYSCPPPGNKQGGDDCIVITRAAPHPTAADMIVGNTLVNDPGNGGPSDDGSGEGGGSSSGFSSTGGQHYIGSAGLRATVAPNTLGPHHGPGAQPLH